VVLSELPAGFPAPVVVAQHLAAARVSVLAGVLGRSSSLPVQTIDRRQRLEDGIVYVVPANRHAEVSGREVLLLEDGPPGPKPSIDRLMSSAASAFGESVVAVILSGTGSDGAVGARAVKLNGGTVIVENPSTAKFSGMPRSLAPSSIDFVADLARIGSLLTSIVSSGRSGVHSLKVNDLDAFLTDVSARSGINFHSYKRSTVRRRLLRRLAATGTHTLVNYRAHLREHPEEYRSLVASFLIKVTEFFRDPEVFEHLRETTLPDIVARAREHGGTLRLWSAGCATGEEAYSLAISLCEVLGSGIDGFDIRIFATDLDPDAVAFARRGTYPASAIAGVPPELVARYFTEEDGEYVVTKRVRSLIVFGQHDLGQRPPFPNVDLILCRNVLIYFTAELQDRALRLFAFSLRDAGYLVLGKAEIATPMADFLRLEHPGLKIYRRHGGAVILPPAQVGDMPRTSPLREFLRRAQNERLAVEAVGRARRRPVHPWFEHLNDIMHDVPVGMVLITASYEIEYINAMARAILGIRASAIGQDVVHAATGAPPRMLKDLIDRAFRTQAATRIQSVEMDDPATGERRYVDIACTPYRRGAQEPGQEAELAELALVDVTEYVTRIQSLSGDLDEVQSARRAADARSEQLTDGMRALDSANRELAALNTALAAANEASVADTEEVQAASEEVETLNEELQASNEELETLNEELQATVEELNTATRTSKRVAWNCRIWR